MPFYCGKRSAGICVVLGPKQSRPPHHLSGAHKHGPTYSSHRAPSTYSLGKERCLGALGVGGRHRLRLRFFRTCGLASASSFFFLATKDYSDRLLDTINRKGPCARFESFPPRATANTPNGGPASV
jgi:hypothetical protein